MSTATAINKRAYDGSTIGVIIDHATVEIYVEGVPQFDLDKALPLFEAIVDDIKKQLQAQPVGDEDEEPGVACDACGGPVDGADGATDDVIVLCGSFYGNGCADMAGAFEYA